MFTNSDINRAVTDGAISAEAAAALLAHGEATTGLSTSDREPQQYYSGYHEVFAISVSIVLALGVAVLIGSSSVTGGAIAGFLTLWGLSELFVRKQGSTYCAVWFTILMWIAGTIALLAMFNGEEVLKNPQYAMMMGEVEPKSFIYTIGGSQLLLAAVFGAYFWRFRQPISAYLLAMSAVFGLIALLVGANYPDALSGNAVLYALLILGLIVAGVALYLDGSDRSRTGIASDTATWLHAGAAGLIAPGLFGLMGSSMTNATEFNGGTGFAALSLVLFLILVLVSILLNRRAYAGAAIIYPIIALTALLADGAPGAKLVAGSAILVGLGMTLLAYFWPQTRAAIVSRLPSGLQAKLPGYRGQISNADEFE